MALLAAVAVDELEVLVFKGQKHWDRVQRGWKAVVQGGKHQGVCFFNSVTQMLIQYVHISFTLWN